MRSQVALMGRKKEKKAAVSQAVRELKDFYELGDDTLWFTIVDGHIWWAFVSGPVIGGEKDSCSNVPARYHRHVRNGWRNTSLGGIPLSVFDIQTSALTRTASYRMTICAVKSTKLPGPQNYGSD